MYSCNIIVYDIENQKPIREIPVEQYGYGYVPEAKLSYDNTLLMIKTHDKCINIHTMNNGELLKRVRIPKNGFSSSSETHSSFELTHDNKFLLASEYKDNWHATAWADGSLYVFDISEASCPKISEMDISHNSSSLLHLDEETKSITFVKERSVYNCLYQGLIGPKKKSYNIGLLFEKAVVAQNSDVKMLLSEIRLLIYSYVFKLNGVNDIVSMLFLNRQNLSTEIDSEQEKICFKLG